MSLRFDYRERARECLALAQSTQNSQTKIWAVELAALLQRLSKKAVGKSKAVGGQSSRGRLKAQQRQRFDAGQQARR